MIKTNTFDERKHLIYDETSSMLVPLGFRRNKAAWTRITDDIGGLFYLQKSDWGPELYPSIGFWFTSLMSKKYVQVLDCPVWLQLRVLFDGDENKIISRAFRLDAIPNDKDTRAMILRISIEFLQRVSDSRSLLAFVRDYETKGLAVKSIARREFLKLNN